MVSPSSISARTRIALVDDHPLFRMGLRAILERDSQLEVVIDVDRGAQALEVAPQGLFDLAIVDCVLPEMSGAAFTAALHRVSPQTKILGLSMLDDPLRIAEMLRAGASGYALKSQPPDRIVEAVHLVIGGVRYLPESVSASEVETLVNEPSAWPLERLTAREREVFALLAEGQSNDDIASRLFIARRTVEAHRHHVMHKLGARSVVDLVRIAMRHGITGA